MGFSDAKVFPRIHIAHAGVLFDFLHDQIHAEPRPIGQVQFALTYS
jgi:hypothetical protein